MEENKKSMFMVVWNNTKDMGIGEYEYCGDITSVKTIVDNIITNINPHIFADSKRIIYPLARLGKVDYIEAMAWIDSEHFNTRTCSIIVVEIKLI